MGCGSGASADSAAFCCRPVGSPTTQRGLGAFAVLLVGCRLAGWSQLRIAMIRASVGGEASSSFDEAPGATSDYISGMAIPVPSSAGVFRAIRSLCGQIPQRQRERHRGQPRARHAVSCALPTRPRYAAGVSGVDRLAAVCLVHGYLDSPVSEVPPSVSGHGGVAPFFASSELRILDCLDPPA